MDRLPIQIPNHGLWWRLWWPPATRRPSVNQSCFIGALGFRDPFRILCPPPPPFCLSGDPPETGSRKVAKRENSWNRTSVGQRRCDLPASSASYFLETLMKGAYWRAWSFGDLLWKVDSWQQCLQLHNLQEFLIFFYYLHEFFFKFFYL